MSANTIITSPLKCAREIITKLECKDSQTGKTGFQTQFEVCTGLYIIRL